MDASKVDKVTVSGTHANEGKADYNDMLIAEGGSSDNSGTEKGNILTVEGTHANSGTSIWNGVTVADFGKGENSGKLDVGNVFDVIGEFVNKGKDAVLDATKTAVTTVAGLLRNEGTANYDDMTVASGGTSNNSGFEKGDILTIADGGQHTNSVHLFGTMSRSRRVLPQLLKSAARKRSTEPMTLRATEPTKVKLTQRRLPILRFPGRSRTKEPPTMTI